MKPRSLKLLYLISALVMINFSVFAAEADKADSGKSNPIHLLGTTLPFFFDGEQRGVYNYLFDQVTAPVQGDFQLTFLPPNRAYRQYHDKKADCYFIANKKNYTDAGTPVDLIDDQVAAETITSETIHISYNKIYSLMGAPVFSNMASLKGKTFAADLVAGANTVLPIILPETKIIATDTLMHSVSLLKAGRVDGIIGYDIGFLALKQMPDAPKDIVADPDFSLQSAESSIICWNSTRNRKFLDTINAEIRQLKSAGTLIDPLTFELP